MGLSSLPIALVALAFGTASCRNVDDLPLAESQSLSLADQGHAWPSSNVEVCFLNSPNDPKAKSVLQVALERSFNKNSTYIHYHGFKDCEPGSSAPAKIRFGVPVAYTARIGTQTLPGVGTLGETIGLPTYENDFSFYNTVVHMFAHFAGLTHNSAAYDERGSAGCTSSAAGKGNLNEMPITLKIGQPQYPDKNSIMNRCLEGFSNRYLRLSDDDVRSLRALYSKSRATTSAQISTSQQSSEDQIAAVDVEEECNEFKIIPADMAKLATRGYPTHTSDGSAIYAYSDDSFSEGAQLGTIKVGTIVTKIRAQVLNRDEASQSADGLKAMQVVPKSGALKDQKLWIIGNVTMVFGCQKNQN